MVSQPMVEVRLELLEELVRTAEQAEHTTLTNAQMRERKDLTAQAHEDIALGYLHDAENSRGDAITAGATLALAHFKAAEVMTRREAGQARIDAITAMNRPGQRKAGCTYAQ